MQWHNLQLYTYSCMFYNRYNSNSDKNSWASVPSFTISQFPIPLDKEIRISVSLNSKKDHQRMRRMRVRMGSSIYRKEANVHKIKLNQGTQTRGWTRRLGKSLGRVESPLLSSQVLFPATLSSPLNYILGYLGATETNNLPFYLS